MPEAARSFAQLTQGKCVMYAVQPLRETPLRAASEIAFCSACTVACSCPSRTQEECGAPGRNPLYPAATILFLCCPPLTITQPTCRRSHAERDAIRIAAHIKYSSQVGLRPHERTAFSTALINSEFSIGNFLDNYAGKQNCKKVHKASQQNKNMPDGMREFFCLSQIEKYAARIEEPAQNEKNERRRGQHLKKLSRNKNY